MRKVGVLFCLMALSCYAAENSKLQNLEKSDNPFSSAVTLEGTATPIITTTIKYGFNDNYRGIITYTAAQGTIFSGPIYDDTGKIIKQGDVLIKLRTAYREAALKAQNAAILQSEATLLQKKQNYDRFKKLINSNSVSMEQFQQTQSDYYNALGAYENQKANLVEVKTMLELCTYHAQFTGIVDKVIFPAGLCAGELDVMQVSQLFPMGIEVKMPREIANKISISTPITVYSSFSDEPLGIGQGFTTLTDDGIRFIVNNYPLSYKNGDKPIQNVHELHTVLPLKFYGVESEFQLSVEKKAILKDSQGYYVWKALGQKNYIPGKGIDHIFKIKKVRVVPGNENEKLQPGIEFVPLKDPGSLEAKDITVSDVPENFKDGDEVYCSVERFLFMPGDPVKVVIGPQKEAQ